MLTAARQHCREQPGPSPQMPQETLHRILIVKATHQRGANPRRGKVSKVPIALKSPKGDKNAASRSIFSIGCGEIGSCELFREIGMDEKRLSYRRKRRQRGERQKEG